MKQTIGSSRFCPQCGYPNLFSCRENDKTIKVKEYCFLCGYCREFSPVATHLESEVIQKIPDIENGWHIKYLLTTEIRGNGVYYLRQKNHDFIMGRFTKDIGSIEAARGWSIPHCNIIEGESYVTYWNEKLNKLYLVYGITGPEHEHWIIGDDEEIQFPAVLTMEEHIKKMETIEQNTIMDEDSNFPNLEFLENFMEYRRFNTYGDDGRLF